MRMSSHLPMHRPHLAFVNASAQSAFATLDRVATVGAYVPTVTYPTNGFAQALRAVAGALAAQIGTRVFWVQTGGYDTHAAQGGSYGTLMTKLNDGLLAFYQDLRIRAAERHARAAVLGVRAPHQRERQRRHGSRRRERHDGHRWAYKAASTAPRRRCRPIPATRRWRTARTTCGTRPTSARSTRASSTAGWAPIGRHPRRRLPRRT